MVTMDEACLWVDGRYFVQASHELEGTSVTMMKMGREGVPDVEEYLEQMLPSKGCLGFDGRVVNAAAGLNLEDILWTGSDRKHMGSPARVVGKAGLGSGPAVCRKMQRR